MSMGMGMGMGMTIVMVIMGQNMIMEMMIPMRSVPTDREPLSPSTISINTSRSRNRWGPLEPRVFSSPAIGLS